MTLYIDSHFNDIYLCLYKNGKIVKEKRIMNENETSKVIMPSVKKLISKTDVENIVVVNGPGSFTGVRIGVTIAKGFAQNLNIPIRTITSLECLAVSLEKDERIVAFSDNKGYYIGIFDENMDLVGNYEYVDKETFNLFSEKYDVDVEPKTNINKIINYALTKEPTNYHQVNPIYIKKIDAEK